MSSSPAIPLSVLASILLTASCFGLLIVAWATLSGCPLDCASIAVLFFGGVWCWSVATIWSH